MKKLFFFASIALISMASCKKSYNCSCTDTDTFDGDTEIYPYTYKIEEASKKQAQAACNEATITTTYSGGYVSKTECNLSK